MRCSHSLEFGHAQGNDALVYVATSPSLYWCGQAIRGVMGDPQESIVTTAFRLSSAFLVGRPSVRRPAD